MYTSGYDGRLQLKTLAGLDGNESGRKMIELVILSILILLGALSIGVKKFIEKRKTNQVIQAVNVLAIQPIVPLHQSQESSNGNLQQSCFNNVAFNKPLLSLLPTIALSILMVAFYIVYFVLNNFELDDNLKGTYFILLIYIIVDFLMPLLYGSKNKDYRKHVGETYKGFFCTIQV